MLTLEIAVGPDDKGATITSLGLNVGSNCLLVLHRRVSKRWLRRTSGESWPDSVRTRLVHVGKYASAEQALRRRVVPVPVVVGEGHAGEMPRNAGHGHGAAAPWRAEVEVEGVILDELGPCVTLSHCQRFGSPYRKHDDVGSTMTRELTACWVPPERCSATALEMDGFSATQRTFILQSARKTRICHELGS